MKIQPFFHADTATITYIVTDEETNQCAIIDSVLDYNLQSGKISYESVQQVIDYVHQNHLQVSWILETHVHADHLTASSYLKEKVGGRIGIGEGIRQVLSHWVPVFNISHDTPTDGSQFDHLFKDNETFLIGNMPVTCWKTPGHTPSCVSYLIKDAIFVGDTIFMPYVGTSRTDFPGGDAQILYESIQRILALPDETRVFTGHDYPLDGNLPAWESTVGQQKKENILVHEEITQEQYVQKRNQRDQGKPVPRLIIPSLQVNLRAGKWGIPEENGVHYIKVPVNQL